MRSLRTVLLALSVTAAAVLLPAASALADGSVSGTATAAGTGDPITGLSVCAEENFVGGVSSGCTNTNARGQYRISGLAAGSKYQVEFSSLGNLSFLTQYWQGKEGLDNWDRVTVTDGATTTGIDAVMNPGAQISGHVSEQGTGAAAEDVNVCVLDPGPGPRAEEFERCRLTDEDGNYVVRSLPAGTYIVVFAPDRKPIDSPWVQEFYDDATTKEAATRISIAPPKTRSGIDATVVNRFQTTLRRARGFHTRTRKGGAMIGFRFSASRSVDSFACKHDSGQWRTCRSPQRFWAPLGRHVFRVRGITSDGDKGPIALSRFRVTH